MPSSGMLSSRMLRGVALARTDVSEELSASIRVTRLGVPPKRRFLQEPYGVSSQKAPFPKVISIITSVIF
jgi:hypothetical protein